jgi:hypothetical protein
MLNLKRWKINLSTCFMSSFLTFSICGLSLASNLMLHLDSAVASPESDQSFCRKIKKARAKTTFGTEEYEQINSQYEAKDCNAILYGQTVRNQQRVLMNNVRNYQSTPAVDPVVQGWRNRMSDTNLQRCPQFGYRNADGVYVCYDSKYQK